MSTTPALFTPLQPATLPLYGSRLIEASAGTGKTWTIAALYIRLILGHGAGTPQGLLPSQILVMTFTRAATLELAERIRERLAHAARYFRGERPDGSTDAYLDELLTDYPDAASRSQAAWRLESAAQVMDEAAIHTIDAWCQRVLAEFAALTGMLGEEQLSASTADILATAALDYWREHVYPLDAQLLEVVTQHWSSALVWQAQSPQLLLRTAQQAANQGASSWPAAEGQGAIRLSDDLPTVLGQAVAEHTQELQALASGWVEKALALQEWLDGQTHKDSPTKSDWDGRKLTPRYYGPWIETIRQWAQNPSPHMDLPASAIHRFSPQGMEEARKNKSTPYCLPPEMAQLHTVLEKLATISSPSRWLEQHAIWHTRARFQALKARAGVFDFADALNLVEQSLNGVHSQALRSRLVARYPVAMIDEFQDTSAQQYRVFSGIYQPQENADTAALLVIGDPKQSIYRFRGADINSYLRVRQETAGRHYALGVNFRSTHNLVSAVNHCFAPAEARAGLGAFRYRTDGNEAHNPVPFIRVSANGRKEYFAAQAGQPLPALHIAAACELHAQPDANEGFAQQCAEQVVQWLNDPDVGFYRDAPTHAPFERLRPADMAILVRTGAEAKRIQQALRARGLPSVYLSDRESVFGSDEAFDLVAWLQAVANPLNVRMARAALASGLLALSVQELERIADDEMALEEHLLTLQALQTIWAKQGILPMLRQTLHQLNLPARWLAAPSGGERKLTNFLHLAELLQQAARTLEAEQALIRWLVAQVAAAGNGQVGDEDSQTVRLESDADLIKIVTIHKSKGLEYPVVFLPFACNYREAATAATASAPSADQEDALEADPQAPNDEEERLREDLRLLYVALTRARHSLWLGFASIKKGRSKTCTTHRSALGYLLAGEPDAPLEPEQWQQVLHDWQAGQAHIAIAAALPFDEVPTSAFVPRGEAIELAAPPMFTGTPDRSWTISSFSALTRNLLQAPAKPPLAPAGAIEREAEPFLPTDAHALPQAPSAPEPTPALWLPLPKGATDEWPLETPANDPQQLLAGDPSQAAPWHALPSGPRMGNFLHDQLEWVGRDGFPAQLDTADCLRITQNATRAGWADHAPALIEWMQAILRTPLPTVTPDGLDGARAQSAAQPMLHQLPASVSELEFWIPARQLTPHALDAFCRQWAFAGQPRAQLSQRASHGMLMGFADLVFEAHGRYWVLDYKTNNLGASAQAYTPEALSHAMLHHRYDLQAMLYMLALHRLLQARLGPRYHPEQHLGGALYWFVRGLDAPSAGLLALPAHAQILTRADAWLATQTPQPLSGVHA